MTACLQQKNMTCGYRNPVYLAVVLLLAATLAVLSAFDLEGSMAMPDGGFSRHSAGENVRGGGPTVQESQPCGGCYHGVRQGTVMESGNVQTDMNP